MYLIKTCFCNAIIYTSYYLQRGTSQGGLGTSFKPVTGATGEDSDPPSYSSDGSSSTSSSSSSTGFADVGF